MAYGADNLPYAVVRSPGGRRFAAVRFGDAVLDLTPLDAGLFGAGTLEPLLAAGPEVWAQVRDAARAALDAGPPLVPLAGVTPVLGFAVADYVDFYASRDHAENAGRIFRPHAEPLTGNWTAMPLGYHGRAGGVVASGTPVPRPAGVLAAGTFEPSRRLDFEAEVGFVVGVPGAHVPVADADRHVFGVCLLNDWSARDVQRFETAPLGPFLGKSFATSVSPWITPLAALQHARVAAPHRPELPHLADTDPPHGLDLDLEVRINGALVSRPRFAGMAWTYAQFVAHLTSNGATLRTGDLLGSGTVSGPVREQRGCLLELTWNGDEPITLPDGTSRTWLLDGDEVVIGASAGSVTLGDVAGMIVTVRDNEVGAG